MPTYQVINIALAILFAVFAGTQVDTSDPLRAGLVYGTASLVCGLAAADRSPPPILTLLFAGLCGLLALSHGFPGLPSRPVGRMFLWPEATEGRQAIGLLVVAVWMAVVARVSARQPRYDAKRGTRSINRV
ncbi:MAG: transmembrane 220 family protein [Myxococcota bacterium]